MEIDYQYKYNIFISLCLFCLLTWLPKHEILILLSWYFWLIFMYILKFADLLTDSIRRYIRSGASAVVLSDAIFEKEVMRQRDFGEIQRLAHLATLQVHQLEYVKQVIPS